MEDNAKVITEYPKQEIDIAEEWQKSRKAQERILETFRENTKILMKIASSLEKISKRI